MRYLIIKEVSVLFFIFSLMLLFHADANALPSFARQTGMPCSSCHVQAFGPGLTSVGRNFKLNGYTQTGANYNEGKVPPIPLSGMVRASYTHTQHRQPGGASERFGSNDNGTIDEASVFLAGRLHSKIGSFIQGTYNGVEDIGELDNSEIRFADNATISGQNLVYGLTVNNNPTITDLWNTTPTWGFPWASSDLAPTQAAGSLIEALGGQVVGATAYMMLNNLLYIEAGGYTMLPRNIQTGIGTFDDGQSRISGGAPYWRVALQKDWQGHYFAVGSFGMQANVYPQRQLGAGTDKIYDYGFDLTYQYLADPTHIYEFNVSYIREQRDMNASVILGLADKKSSNLDTVRIRAGYTYKQTYGLNLFYGQTTGTADSAVYSFGDPISGSRTGNPNSQAFTAEISYTPFGKSVSPLATLANLRLAAQYVHHFKFNGGVHNYDGLGRNAVNNDTLYLNAWLAF